MCMIGILECLNPILWTSFLFPFPFTLSDVYELVSYQSPHSQINPIEACMHKERKTKNEMKVKSMGVAEKWEWMWNCKMWK